MLIQGIMLVYERKNHKNALLYSPCIKTKFQIGPKGKVVGIEHIPQLVQLSINNLKKNHASLLENGVVKIVEGDGRLGYEKDAPYDAIHVGAAAPEIPSKVSLHFFWIFHRSAFGGQEQKLYTVCRTKLAPEKID
jgi:hypothetical protein